MNGEERPYRGESVREMLAVSGIDPDRRGVAVAVNAEVLPRSRWDETRLKPGDRLEVVQPLQGG